MPHGEGRCGDVAATHDERERPGHRHDEHDGHDGYDGHDAGEQGGRRAACAGKDARPDLFLEARDVLLRPRRDAPRACQFKG